MTREEARNILADFDVNFEGHTAGEIADAFDLAFRALEQEPCEDAISRAEVKKTINELYYQTKEFEQKVALEAVGMRIVKLPSVQPTAKVGHWKRLKVGYGCSNCDLATNQFGHEMYRYCPNCGSKMEEGNDDKRGE